MNRFEEYQQLKEELKDSPAELDYLVTRARSRMKKRNCYKHFILAPVSIVLTLFLIFVFSVNTLPQFALACGKIPVIENLAKAVLFSDTLSKAVENDYYQEVNMKKTQDGVSLEIKYLIADEHNLCVFYKVDTKEKEDCFYNPEIYTIDGKKIEGYFSSVGMQGDLKIIEINFIKTQVPEKLILSGDIKTTIEQQIITKMTAEIKIDKDRIAQTKEISVNKSFKLDQEKYTVEKAFISPLSLELRLSEDSSNIKTLSSLDFYVVDEEDRRYELSLSIGSQSGSYLTFYTGSTYFEKVKELTIVVEGATFCEKEGTEIEVDLKNKKISHLPEFVQLIDITTNEGKSAITFAINEQGLPQAEFISSFYRGKDGKKYQTKSVKRTNGYYDDKENKVSKEYPGCMIETVEIDQDNNDIVYLQPNYSSILKLEESIYIPIRMK